MSLNRTATPTPPDGPPNRFSGVHSGNIDVESQEGASPSRRLLLNPNSDHEPDDYEDLELDFTPSIFTSLERYLPSDLLAETRDVKINYMRDILVEYYPMKLQKQREYRQKILANYQHLHEELYTMNAEDFFVPSFLEAIKENTERGFRNIMSEPFPGIFTFEMFQPRFCEMLLAEVANFEKWVEETEFRIIRPSMFNKYGAALDDFGMEPMLDKLMEDFVCPISTVFFPEVGGSTLDAHHGFVLEYGLDRDIQLGFHVDDSEVTLNVCLGKQFSGGELFFRGMRCEKHVNSKIHSEEFFDYKHVPGHAVLHHGRHRHGARATISGRRTNFVLWCRSSVFRELTKYRKDFSDWCTECQLEKRERQRQYVASYPTGIAMERL